MEIFSLQRICLWKGRSSYSCAMFPSISRKVVIGRNCRETMRSVENFLFVRVQAWLSRSRRTRSRLSTRLFVGTRISRAEVILLLYRRSWVRLLRKEMSLAFYWSIVFLRYSFFCFLLILSYCFYIICLV